PAQHRARHPCCPWSTPPHITPGSSRPCSITSLSSRPRRICLSSFGRRLAPDLPFSRSRFGARRDSSSWAPLTGAKETQHRRSLRRLRFGLQRPWRSTVRSPVSLLVAFLLLSIAACAEQQEMAASVPAPESIQLPSVAELQSTVRNRIPLKTKWSQIVVEEAGRDSVKLAVIYNSM